MLVKMFADDTACFLDDNNIQSLQRLVNFELNNISNWLKANKLSINIKKTKFILFHPKSVKLKNDFKILYDNIELERVPYIKYLGIYIDEHLKWNYHLHLLNNKIAKLVGIFYKLRNIMPLENMIQVYYTIIYPHLNYGIMCLGTSTQNNMKRSQILQNKILRTITFSNLYDHISPLYKQLKILNIEKIFVFKILKFMYRINHNRDTIPAPISDLFSAPSHDHNTRYSVSNYTTFHTINNYGLSAPSRVSSSLWFALPEHLKLLPFTAFKKDLLSILFETL